MAHWCDGSRVVCAAQFEAVFNMGGVIEAVQPTKYLQQYQYKQPSKQPPNDWIKPPGLSAPPSALLPLFPPPQAPLQSSDAFGANLRPKVLVALRSCLGQV